MRGPRRWGHQPRNVALNTGPAFFGADEPDSVTQKLPLPVGPAGPAFASTIGEGPTRVTRVLDKNGDMPFHGARAGRAWGVMAQIRDASPEMTAVPAGHTVSEYARRLLTQDVAMFESRAAVLRRDAAEEEDSEIAVRRLVIASQLDRLADDYRVLLLLSAPRVTHQT